MGKIYFARVLYTNPELLNYRGLVKIYLTNSISICTQSKEQCFMSCLDFPVDLVAEVDIQTRVVEKSLDQSGHEAKTHRYEVYDLAMKLKPPRKNTCFVNASSVNIHEIGLTISGQIDVQDIVDDIQSLSGTIVPPKGPKISQSDGTIAIAPFEDGPQHTPGEGLVEPRVEVPASDPRESHDNNNSESLSELIEDLEADSHETLVVYDSYEVPGGLSIDPSEFVNPEDTQLKPSQRLLESIAVATQVSPNASAPFPHDNGGAVVENDTIEHVSQFEHLERASPGIYGAESDIDNEPDNHEVNSRISNAVVPHQALQPADRSAVGGQDVDGEHSHAEDEVLAAARPDQQNQSKVEKSPDRQNGNRKGQAIQPTKGSTQQRRRRKGPVLKPKKQHQRLQGAKSSNGPPPPTKRKREARTANGTTPTKDLPRAYSQAFEVEVLSGDFTPRPAKSTKKALNGGSKSNVSRLEESLPQPKSAGVSAFASGLTNALEAFESAKKPTAQRSAGEQIFPPSGDPADDIFAAIDSAPRKQNRSSMHDTRPSGSTAQRRHARQPKTEQVTTRSPRLLARTREAAETLNKVLSNQTPVVDDKMARKTPLIGFDSKGPRNQGRGRPDGSSVLRSKGTQRVSGIRMARQDERHDAGTGQKQVQAVNGSAQSTQQPGAKSLQSPYSPIHGRQSTFGAAGDDDDYIVADVSPMLSSQHLSGSQRARVDANGSPQPMNSSLQQQRFLSVANGMVENPDNKSENIQQVGQIINISDDEEEEDEDDDIVPTDRLPSTQGASIPVARRDVETGTAPPRSSPTVIARWAPTRVTRSPDRHTQGDIHIRMGEDMSSGRQEAKVQQSNEKHRTVQESVPRKRIRVEPALQLLDEHNNMLSFQTADPLADPFTERKPKRQRSDFEERLVQSSIKRPGPRISLYDEKFAAKSAPLFEDPEITLVGGFSEPPGGNPSSPEPTQYMSSEESTASWRRHKEAHIRLAQDLDEEWRQALEPHQKSMLDTLYQISDDLVRYLVSHEQAIKDLHAGYLKNGMTLIDDLDRKYQQEKTRVRHELKIRKNAVRTRLDDFQVRIAKDVGGVRAEDLSDLEHDMRRNQDNIAQKIRAGRA
jgi:hypothetical protein